MNTNESYIVPNWSGFSSIWKAVAIILAVLVILFYLLGYGPGGDHCQACDASEAVSDAGVVPAESAFNDVVELEPIVEEVSTPEVEEALSPEVAAVALIPAVMATGFLDYVVPEYQYRDNISVEKLYFDLGSYDLPDNTPSTLSTVIAYLRNNEGSVAIISGFHDQSGDLLSNQELAKNRAVAVRDYLIAQNLNQDRLVLEKPVQTTGSGSAVEARRVDVGIADLGI